MRTALAYLLLRLAASLLRVPIPDWHHGTSLGFKMRIVLARVTLSINSFKPCVLGNGSRGWARGIPKVDEQRGTAKYALEQIHAVMPNEI